jgi:hypothetical protein
MNFPGCTNEMHEDAKMYIWSAYRLDSSPEALGKARRRKELQKAREMTMMTPVIRKDRREVPGNQFLRFSNITYVPAYILFYCNVYDNS